METISHFDLTCQLCPPSGCVQAQHRVQVIFRSFCQFWQMLRGKKVKESVKKKINYIYDVGGCYRCEMQAVRSTAQAPRRVERPSVAVDIVDKLKIEKMAGHSLCAVINSRPQTCCFGSKESVFRAALQFEVDWIWKKKTRVTVLHRLSLLCCFSIKKSNMQSSVNLG